MVPPTNGLVSLAFPPAPEMLLLPFDHLPAFPSDDFLAPPPPDAPTHLLLPADCAAKDLVPAPPPPLPAAAGQRTSNYRGVTRHRWTGRYEAHLWDNTCRREGQKRKGRQVYLGGYDKEDKAARAYDLAALKYWGVGATTNFPKENYIREIEEMQKMSKQELVASLRRKSSGFSRGASIYRGVTRHHQHGRWQARIGRVAGNKDLYLGTFATEEEAAEAYDIAALKFRGPNAVTNFEHSRYNLEAIAGSDLPISGSARRLNKPAPEAEDQIVLSASHFAQHSNSGHSNVPPYLFQNLLQLYPSEPSETLPGYGFDEANFTVGRESFYWLAGNGQHKVEFDNKIEWSGGILQLANSAAN